MLAVEAKAAAVPESVLLRQGQFGTTYLCVERANGKEFTCMSILIPETHSVGLGQTKSMAHH